MPKRCVQRIYRHGNALALTLPRHLLYDLGWLCNEEVIVELLQDNTLWIRPPTFEDFKPAKSRTPPIPKQEPATT